MTQLNNAEPSSFRGRHGVTDRWRDRAKRCDDDDLLV
jgi:hypothetical protein